jgi:peptide/nickel transport system permease protein
MVGSAETMRASGPWRVAMARLARNRSAWAASALLLTIVSLCLLAPLYAQRVTGVDPFQSNIEGVVEIDGQVRNLLEPNTEGLGIGSTPIGPTWNLAAYFLGADAQGRDVAGRLLYGGRNSLLIGAAATAIPLAVACFVGIAAGYFGGMTDMIISRGLDVLWAFPVYLLAISLSIVLISGGFKIGPFTLTSGSLWLPIWIVGIVYVPYVARPIRGRVLTLRESEFILASVCLGVSPHRILLRDILPNVATTVIVFAPLMMALSVLAESALSFLSIGVQPPDASWGTIIQDGLELLYSRPIVVLAPGVAVGLTVLALNVLGEALREAIDPRAKLRVA